MVYNAAPEKETKYPDGNNETNSKLKDLKHEIQETQDPKEKIHEMFKNAKRNILQEIQNSRYTIEQKQEMKRKILSVQIEIIEKRARNSNTGEIILGFYNTKSHKIRIFTGDKSLLVEGREDQYKKVIEDALKKSIGRKDGVSGSKQNTKTYKKNRKYKVKK